MAATLDDTQCLVCLGCLPSAGLGNRDPETQQDRSLSVIYISCMWLTYYSREGRCEHSGGLGVAYVSQMIEIEACEGYDWLLDSLKN
jgi:hypothetical protein